MIFEIDFIERNSREGVIRELQRLATALGKNTISQRDIDTHGRISSSAVQRRFGSLRKGLQAAGLTPRKFTKATDQELYSTLIQLWTHTLKVFGRSPYCRELQEFGYPISYDTYARRFGSWNNALLAAAEVMRASGAFEEAARQPVPPPPSGTTSTGRRSLSVRKRFLVFKRDRYRCRICKRSGVELEVDHKVPLAQGGSNALDNLQTLCSDCNRGKRHSSE